MPTLYEERKRGRQPAGRNPVYLTELEPPARGRRFVTDQHRDAPKGFGARVEANGRVSFAIRYKVRGRDRLLKIGDWGTWSLTAAREQAQTYRRRIDADADPLAERDEQRAAQAAADAELTVREAVDLYCRRHADALTSGPAIRRGLERYPAAKFGDRKLTDVRRRDVVELVERIAKDEGHGRQAAHVLQYIKQLFAWAEDREYVAANPVATLRAGKIADEMKPRRRERVLTAKEIRAVWNLTDPPARMDRGTLIALQLILATGQRPGEVARMRFADIDRKAGVWTIPAEHRGKTGEAHAVPLTGAALALIDAAPGAPDREHVFERVHGQAMGGNALQQAARKCRTALGNTDTGAGYWTPHDLRRTARTGMAAAGVSDEVAERVVGHAKTGMTAVYNRHGYVHEKRRALEAWQARLETIARGEDPDADTADVHDIAEADTASA